MRCELVKDGEGDECESEEYFIVCYNKPRQ